ncbi:MAG TPA: VWA domain-containing protein [Patescibacteria group bacterium]|nr:VWA domain-containing protein [Patescibacteria group bacterium]
MENIEKSLKSENLSEQNIEEDSLDLSFKNEVRRRYEELMKKEKQGENVDLNKRWPSQKLKYYFGENLELKPSPNSNWCTQTDLGKKELFYPVNAISIPDDISEQEKEEKLEIIDGGVVHEAGHHLGVVKVLENFIFEKDTQNKLFSQFEIKSAPLRNRKNIEKQLRQRGELLLGQNINVGPYIGNILFLKDLHNIILDIWLESYEKQLSDSKFTKKVKRGLDSLNKDLFPDEAPETIGFQKLRLNKKQFKARFKDHNQLRRYLLNNMPEDVKDYITEQQINEFILNIENQLEKGGEVTLKKSKLLSSQFKSAILLAAMRPDWEEWQGEELALWQKQGWVDPRVAESLNRIKEQGAFKNLLTARGLDEAFTPREVIKWIQKNKIKESYNQIRAEFLKLFDIDFENKVEEVAPRYDIKSKNKINDKETFDGGGMDKKSLTKQDANDILSDILIKGLKDSQEGQGGSQGDSQDQGEEGQQGESGNQGQQQPGSEQGQGQEQPGEMQSGGSGGGREFGDLPQQGQREILDELLDQMGQESVGTESLTEEEQELSEEIQDQARDSIPSMNDEGEAGDKDEKDEKGESQEQSEEEGDGEMDEREARLQRRMSANQRRAQRHESREMEKAELLDLSLEEYRDYEKAKERLYRQIKILTDKLSDIIIANREMQVKKRLPHGRLTSGKLGSFVRAVTSGYEPDSFELPKLAEKPMNVDLMFLVDHSSSMSGDPIQAAADSVLIWAEAIRRAENKIEKKTSTSRKDREGLRMGLMTFSNQPVLWSDLKSELTDRDIAQIYTKTKDLEGGFTADSSAVKELLKYLNKEGSRNKQKTLQIVLVLTDGQGEYNKVEKVINENMKNKASLLVALGMGDDTKDVLETYKSDKHKDRVIARSIPDKDISKTGEISSQTLVKPIKEILLGR